MRLGSNNGHSKILVIGNQPAITVSLRTMLTLRELDVVAVAEVQEALRAVKADGPIRLALIDVRTVEMEPRALGERLRRIQPELKILFFSSLLDGVVIRMGIIDPERNVLRSEGVMAAIEEALGLGGDVGGGRAKGGLKTMTAGGGGAPTQ
jgi:DNA-binding NtrC family response regulator